MKSFIHLEKRVLGIDIADHTLSLVEVAKRPQRAQVTGFVQSRIPPGVVVRGRIRDEEKLQEIFANALLSMKPKPARARAGVYGLPESQVYAHAFHATPKSPEGLKDLIEKEALETVPLNRSEMALTNTVANAKEKEKDILLLAVHRDVLREWYLFFTRAGMSVSVYDSEILAQYRGLNPKIKKGVTALVDCGAVSNTIGIFDGSGFLQYVYSFEGAGDDLTDTIATHAKISSDDAEKLKLTLDMQDPPANLGTILPSFFDPLVKEIKVGIGSFHQIKSQEVERVVLLGGTSNMKGLDTYLSEQLGINVVHAESVQLNGVALQKGQMVEAIGLALRLLYKNHINKDPFFKNPTEEELLANLPGGEKRQRTGARVSGAEREAEFHDVQREKRQLHKQILVLILVLVLGAGALFTAFWYQSASEKEKEQKLKSLTPQYTFTQKLEMTLPLGTSARLYRFPVPSQPIADSMYLEAQNSLSRQVNDTEDFFREPVNALIEPSVKPVTSLAYVIFNKDSLRGSVKTEINAQNTTGIPYDIGAIEYKTIQKDPLNPNGFVLMLIAHVSSQSTLPWTAE